MPGQPGLAGDAPAICQALPGLLARAEADLKRCQAGLEQARAEIVALAGGSRQHSGELVRLDGVQAVRDRLRRLSGAARAEVCSLSLGSEGQADPMSPSKPVSQELLERRVTVRSVYQDSYRHDPAAAAHATWMAEHGAHLRIVPVVPMPLVLVDRAVAIVPVSAAEPHADALEIRNLSIVATAAAMFEQVWQAATPLGQSPPAGDHGLRPLEQQILLMLSDGATDELIARKVGVSVRTIRRTIADLTERLRASSRFQAGVNAGRAGWV